MPRYAHPDVLTNGPQYIKDHCNAVVLTKAYSSVYATVNGANKVASAALVTGDFSISAPDGAAATLTAAISGKSAGNALINTVQHDNGTATGGAATTLTDTAKSWTVNGYAGKAVVITGGTGSGQSRHVLSNTATVLTVESAWATTPDATSTYKVVDDMHTVFVDTTASKVLYVTQESTDQLITAGNPVSFNTNLTYVAGQPTA